MFELYVYALAAYGVYRLLRDFHDWGKVRPPGSEKYDW